MDANTNDNSKILKIILSINFLLVITTFTLNFLGSPLLKYTYILTAIFTILATLLLNLFDLLPVIFTLFFFEGQGRILWDNANWTKFIFDGVVLLSVFKVFITNKKVFNIKALPRPFLLLIILHFIWYGVEIVNLNNVSTLAALAASKLYIYPILYFLSLSQTDLDVYSSKFQNFLNFVVFFLFMEVILILIQYLLKEKFLLQISPHYQAAMKDIIFTGSMYRPFGTSFVPGSISVLFYLTLGFLFFKKNSRWGNFFKFILIPLLTLAIILCQVRSALLKFVIIFLLIQIGDLVFQRFRLKSLINIFFTLSILLLGSIYISNLDISSDAKNSSLSSDEEVQTFTKGIEKVRDRFSSLSETKVLKNSRIDITQFFNIASEKIVHTPLGYGPGFTGVLLRMGLTETSSHFINVNEYWTNDNLFMSLVIELGIGAIFYILVLFYMPIYFLKFLIKFYKYKMNLEFKVLLVCFSSVTTIILGNWGVVGIVYNPESFMFWFFAALGFSTITKYKNELKVTEGP